LDVQWSPWWASVSSMWGLPDTPNGTDPCSLAQTRCCSREGKYLLPQGHASFEDAFIAVLAKYHAPLYRTVACTTPGEVVAVSFSSSVLKPGTDLADMPEPPGHVQLLDLTLIQGTQYTTSLCSCQHSHSYSIPHAAFIHCRLQQHINQLAYVGRTS
jgi:hypothetical protein